MSFCCLFMLFFLGEREVGGGFIGRPGSTRYDWRGYASNGLLKLD